MSQDTNTSPAGSEVNEFEYVSEDFPHVGHVEQHERHAHDGVQDGGDLSPLGARRQIAVPCASQTRLIYFIDYYLRKYTKSDGGRLQPQPSSNIKRHYMKILRILYEHI